METLAWLDKVLDYAEAVRAAAEDAAVKGEHALHDLAEWLKSLKLNPDEPTPMFASPDVAKKVKECEAACKKALAACKPKKGAKKGAKPVGAIGPGVQLFLQILLAILSALKKQ